MESETQRPERGLWSLSALVSGYAIVDFLGPVFVEGAGADGWVVFAPLSGAITGQICFFTVWAVLGPYRLRARWLAILSIVFLLYCSFCAGILVTAPHPGAASRALADMLAASLLIPLLFLIIQIPLWIRRVISGWEIVPSRRAAEYSAAGARQFGIRHMLTVMFLLAAALSLAQVGLTVFPGRETNTGVPQDAWLALGAYCLALCVYVAVWAGPSLRACFLARTKQRGFWAIAGLCAVVSVLVSIGTAAIRIPLGIPPEVTMGVFLHYAALGAVLMASLQLLKARGYVLIRTGKEHEPTIEKRTEGAQDVPPSADDGDPPDGR